MNHVKQYFLICLLILAGISKVFGANEHFTYNIDTDNNMVVVVNTDANPSIGLEPLEIGDEIGAFSPAGVCVGGIVWAGVNDALTVYGYSSNSNPNGIKNGETISFRVWDASEGIELTSVAVTYIEGNGTYDPSVPFKVLSSLVAAKKPGKPSFTNPTNNGVGVALNGTITWNAAAGATTHSAELSSVSNFTSIIKSGNGNITSLAYSGLNYNTTYYANGTNSEGTGDFETISFKTLLETPTLLAPANNAKGLNETFVNLSWNGVSGASSYTVQLSTISDFSVIFDERVIVGTNTNFDNLNNFTEYFWRVKANDAMNYSEFSSSRNFVTRVGQTTITNPANNSTGVSTDGNCIWTAVPGATSYDVVLVKLPNTIISTNNTSSTQISYSALENFTNYEASVTAKNSDGSGLVTKSQFRTVLGVPVLLTPTNNSFNNEIMGDLTWSPVTGATNYDVRLATDAGFNNIVSFQNDLAATSFSYAGLNPNQKYYWQVRAKNNEGSTVFSSAFAFTTELAKVTLLLPANNQTQVTLNPVLSWNALAGATFYHVQVATNSNFTNIIYENETVVGLSVILNPLNGKTNYYFRVHGYNANNDGPFSDVNMFTTELGKVILQTPTNNAQGLLAENGILTWQSQSGVTGYDILISTNSDLSNPIVSASTVNNSYIYSGLNNNTTYFWAVRSTDEEGVGPFSDTRSFGTKILAPTLLTPMNNSENVVLQGSCSWNSVVGATSYELQIATDGLFNTVVFSESGINGTTGNYEGLENNKLHYWRVRAYKNEGAGLWSNPYSFTTMTLAPPTLVYPPNNSIDLFTSVSLVWNTVNDALGYNVRIATDPNFVNVVATGNNINGTNFNVSNLFVDRDYYWQAQTIGAQGVSNWSNAFKFTTLGNPVIYGIETTCENKNQTYSTTVSPLIDYQWQVTGGTIIGSSTSSTVNVLWGNAGQGTVKLIRTSDIWGNYTDSKIKDVIKTSVAGVDITVAANTYFDNKACLNEVVSITSANNSNGIFTYTWKLGENIVSNSPSFNYHFTEAGTFVFTLTAIGEDCEGGSATLTINVDGNCPVTIINEDDIYSCKNESPELKTIVIGGSGQFEYVWSPANDLVNSTVVSPIVISSVISKTYKLIVTDLVSNIDYVDLVDLIVRNSPTISFSPASMVVRNSNPVDLTDNGNLAITINGGTAPYSYYWEDNNGNQIDPTYVQPNVGSNRYYLTVSDANGCKSAAKRFIIIRYNSKEVGDNDLVTGLSGEGYVLSYPNPVTDDLNIFADFGNTQNARVRVLNLLGQEVFSANLGTIDVYEGSFNLSQLTSGAYTLIIESDTNTFVKSFIKK
jgi:hypothetical protein